jgi:hypothetical protein
MHTINIGQFYGGLMGAVFWIFAGIWCLYIRPRSIRRRIDRGDIDAFDRLAKLRKAPLFGYMFLLIAFFDLIHTLWYIGALGDSVDLALGGAVVVGMILVLRALYRR